MIEEVPLEIRLKELRARFEKAWCKQTTYIADFDPETPSTGQCYVTALCVQDVLGGEIVQGKVFNINHFWNMIGGQEFDLTSDQFIGGDGIHKHKKAEMSNKCPHTNRRNERYLLLKKHIGEA